MILIETAVGLSNKLKKKREKHTEQKDAIEYVSTSLIDITDNNHKSLEDIAKKLQEAIHEDSTNLTQEGLEYRKVKSAIKELKSQIRKLYNSDYDGFLELKKNVEMLVGVITSANYWVVQGIKTKTEVRELIQNNKKAIIDILGMEIKLAKPVEDFLKGVE